MIIGIGTDIVDIRLIESMIERHGQKIIDKLFTKKEQEKVALRKNKGATYAKLFAAKEAFIKAMGDSYAMNWHDMEILNDPLGKPVFYTYKEASRLLEEKKIKNIHISLSDDPPYATAFVVLEG